MVTALFKKLVWQPAFRMQSKLKEWHARSWIIPPYEEKRNIIRSYQKQYGLDVLVETGTFMGDTVDALRKDFRKIYSVELSEDLADKAAKRFAGDERVTIVKGNSGLIMKQLLGDIDCPCLFWLDGHYSSEFFVNGSYIKTARGEKHTPVVEELEAILSSKHAKKHVALIDDARLFKGTNDYPDISELKQLIHRYDPSVTVEVKRDIIRIERKL
jgi:hypothetical protein